ncbi:adenosine deaminase [Microlunatus elymi]|uniref:adenosine deaminase n=1 Tax=Microlunatus elymi TaxID=2596828 RepID=A0A516PWU1_9ACTN|nr:adenosine deaminase [Microlunatus elymi]QDP95655.1 adenosine deaminase [Microlunatus elymi]
MAVDLDLLRRAPKVLLHDHLDGGLRPGTIIELAAECGHRLPAEDPQKLARWFAESADSGALERYLETFEHTVAVMQTASALRRVAAEMVADLADDGVVYVETRWAPEQHLHGGLSLRQTVEAVQHGLEDGMAVAAGQGHKITARQLLTAMRHAEDSRQIAELVVSCRDLGIAGFDIAGAEAGYPPSRYRGSFDYLKRNNARITVHAGEGFGLPSIWEAVQLCGANRLGHGVRIIDDIPFGDGVAELGDLAAYVRDLRIPLEMCPTSNVQTGAVASIAEHPIKLLADLGFRVTVNTDNRLMSNTSMTGEFAALSEAFGFGLDDFRWLTLNAAKSAFFPHPERLKLIEEQIKPGYAELAART